jgi:uncharacterized protein (TIGR02284 family)
MMDINRMRVSKLNDVLELLEDSVKGYTTCLEIEKEANYQNMFQRSLTERLAYTTQLREYINALGGDASEGGDTQGALHRTWIDIKSVFAGNKTEVLLEEAHKGDSVIADTVMKTMEDDDITPEDRMLIGRFMAGITLSISSLQTCIDREKQPDAKSA